MAGKDPSNSPPGAPPRPTAQQAREARLAKALRDNLRRRKGLRTLRPVGDPDGPMEPEQS